MAKNSSDRALTGNRKTFDAMRRFGLTLPGTREDHPWGELVLKAKDKVFVFLGKSQDGPLCFSVKLPDSGTRLLDQDYAEPTGYGLGKSGWVTLNLAGHELSEDELLALIEESYRAVAPKTLRKELDGRSGAADGAPAPRAAKPKAGAKRKARPKRPR